MGVPPAQEVIVPLGMFGHSARSPPRPVPGIVHTAPELLHLFSGTGLVSRLHVHATHSGSTPVPGVEPPDPPVPATQYSG